MQVETGCGKEVMATRETSGINKGSRLPRTRKEAEKGQKRLDWKEEGNSNRMTEREKKKVTFENNDKESEVKDERKKIEDIRKEMKDSIERGMYEIKKEIKKCQEGMEEYKKKDRNTGVRMRLLEERLEEIDTDIKKLKDGIERIKNKIKENCEEDRKDRMSMRSQYNKCNSRRGSSWGGSMASSISQESLSIAEVGKLKKLLTEKEREERRI